MIYYGIETKWRFPDKPAIQIGRAGLAKLPGNYIAELKLDGWRCVVERAATGWSFTSRHKQPIPISRDLAATIAATLDNLPAGTILDGEWIGRRPSCREEALWLFDVLAIGDRQL
jgi:ATP-dependent DNA ligase